MDFHWDSPMAIRIKIRKVTVKVTPKPRARDSETRLDFHLGSPMLKVKDWGFRWDSRSGSQRPTDSETLTQKGTLMQKQMETRMRIQMGFRWATLRPTDLNWVIPKVTRKHQLFLM